MAMRMTGMVSGLDTDSIIEKLMDVHKLKNKKTTDKSQILEWKQDKLKELNTKLYKLYAEDLTKLKLQSSFNTKKVSTTNDSAVSVTAGTSVSNGSHTISDLKLASSQYLTSVQLKVGDENAKGTTKLTELGMTTGAVIKIGTSSAPSNITITEGMTINDFVTKAKSAGINASYDATQGRLFLSSKSTGVDNRFTIEESGDSATSIKESMKESLKDSMGYSTLTESKKVDADNAINTILTADDASADYANAKTLLTGLVKDKNNSDVDSYAINTYGSAIKESIKNGGEYSVAIGTSKINVAKESLETITTEAKTELVAHKDDDDYNEQLANKIAEKIDNQVASTLSSIATALKTSDKINSTDAQNNKYYESNVVSKFETKLSDYEKAVKNNNVTTDNLSKLGIGAITLENNVISSNLLTGSSYVPATDSSLVYNGTTIISKTNSVQVNGLTINIKGESSSPISLTVTNDSQKVYDSVKAFVTKYNEILKEMNTLYYADSASGYAPLSDDEKEAMTDSQIEKWESKIKDSMLRRDDSIGNVLNVLKSATSTRFTASDNKSYSLSSFGITTSTDYTEKGLLHIEGDEDDSTYSMSTNKLMNALDSNPDIVSEALSNIMTSLYDKIGKSIKSIPNVRSAFTFYNDKTMSTQQTAYKKKITELESKLTDIEDKYYKQYSAMETAMSKLQEQQSALSGLLGTS